MEANRSKQHLTKYAYLIRQSCLKWPEHCPINTSDGKQRLLLLIQPFLIDFFPRIILHNQLALPKFGRRESIPSIRWCGAPIVDEIHREICFAYSSIFVRPVLDSNVAISSPNNLRLLYHFLEFTDAKQLGCSPVAWKPGCDYLLGHCIILSMVYCSHLPNLVHTITAQILARLLEKEYTLLPSAQSFTIREQRIRAQSSNSLKITDCHVLLVFCSCLLFVCFNIVKGYIKNENIAPSQVLLSGPKRKPSGQAEKN